jgi:hypothetical protein
MAGPPVLKRNAVLPLTACPASDLKPGFSVNSQRTPAGTSCVKSWTQVLSSTQRPLPVIGVGWAQLTSTSRAAVRNGMLKAIVRPLLPVLALQSIHHGARKRVASEYRSGA